MIPSDLHVLMQRMLDGELSASEVATLERDLVASPESRETWLRLARMHSALEVHFGSLANIQRSPVVPIDRVLARQRRQIVRASLLATAAVLLVSAVALWLKLAPQYPASLARFRIAPDSEFTLTHASEEAPPGANTLSEGSRLRLTHGTMEGEFTSGARFVIEAPCDLSVLARNRISLAEGVAWFHVPNEAAGFTVETRRFTVVDLGTNFGVVALNGGEHEVHVTKGAVQVTARQSAGTAQTLRAGQARRVDASGKLHEVPYDADRFTTTLPQALVIKNPNFDSADGDMSDHDPLGYGPITAWATSGAGVGTGSRSQPFLNQQAHSGTHAAFIQGKGGISQTVSGFDPGKRYTVTYFVSERGLPGAVTSTSVSLDLGASFYMPAGKVIKTDAFRRVVSGPLAVFGPTANIEVKATPVSGDATLLVDSVSVTRAVPSIADGGFENPVQPSGEFKQATGTGAGSLLGTSWSFSGGAGITKNNSDFLPPLAPEGSQAAILQNAGAIFSSVVSGFEPGVTYRLHLDAAGRSGGAAGLRVSLGDAALSFRDSETLTPPVGTYQSCASNEFLAEQESVTLRIESTSKGTSFLDDLRFEFVAEARENE